MKRRQFLLFLIIIIEGYVVLATELLAIRQLIPFVGSGTEVVSIVISAILLPLAIGYHAGGSRAEKELKERRAQGHRSISIRMILLRNLRIALMILVMGLSYPVLEGFFAALDNLGIRHRILQTAVYSLTFLVTPTFLLAQTVPLVSNYFSQTRLSEITGRMLFFSTTGSFLGSIVSSIVLMSAIGVHNTVNVTVSLVAFLIVLIAPRWMMYDNAMALMFVCFAWYVNGEAAMQDLHIVADTPYSTVSIEKVPEDDNTLLHINRSTSSSFSPDPAKRFPYRQYIEDRFINPAVKKGKPRNILVLGAGGFTIGWEDTLDHYTFVDIDAQLKKIAQEYLLPGPLSPNKQFIPTSARAFLRRTGETYDLVIVDLYSNLMTIPPEGVTREFMRDTKRVLKPGGVLVTNVICSPTYDDKFSVRYYHTFASVFPVFDRTVLGKFDGRTADMKLSNTLYIYYDNPYMQDRAVYTDDRNTYSFDR